MIITFLECTKTSYDGNTIKTKPLGGIESTTISLAEAFVRKGHEVCVVNQNKARYRTEINGVHWSNYEIFDFQDSANHPDTVIANNNAPLLDLFPNQMKRNRMQHVLWLHNPVNLFQTLKKNRMATIIRKRPVAVFLGEEQNKQCSMLHPFQKRLIIPHGLSEAFISQASHDHLSREKQAIFFSQAYRGFAEVVDLWLKYVSLNEPDATLKAYVGDINLNEYKISKTREELELYGIKIMPKVEKEVLIEDLKKSRCMIYLGHKDETFCVAALEANAMGVPIVTYGRGSLSERVIDKHNGFLVRDGNGKEASNKIFALLNDDNLFNTMSHHSVEHVHSMTWDKIADQWEEYVFKNSKKNTTS